MTPRQVGDTWVDDEGGYDAEITHFMVVSDDGEGISYSISTREEPDRYRCRERAEYWLRAGYHIEVRRQRFTVGPSVWERVE